MALEAQDARKDLLDVEAPNRTNNVSANDYTSIVDEIGDEGNVSKTDVTNKTNDQKKLHVRAGEIRASLTIKPQKSIGAKSNEGEE